MYQYDQLDQAFIDERVAEFRDQTRRHLAGELSEDSSAAAPAQRPVPCAARAGCCTAIPYGLLAARQLTRLAATTRRYDRGYGHFTTRQNLQLNRLRLADVPDILAEPRYGADAVPSRPAATACATSPPITSPGLTPEEVDDPRPYCETWSSASGRHCILSSPTCRASSRSRDRREGDRATAGGDIGLHLQRDAGRAFGFSVLVGGGLGRAPMIGHVIREFLPLGELLAYLEAILRVYNRHGRRDNINKARVKVLVKSLGPATFREQVEAQWRAGRAHAPRLLPEQIERVRAFFRPQPYESSPDLDIVAGREAAFLAWYRYQHARAPRAGLPRGVRVAGARQGPRRHDGTADAESLAALAVERVSARPHPRDPQCQNLLLADARTE